MLKRYRLSSRFARDAQLSAYVDALFLPPTVIQDAGLPAASAADRYHALLAEPIDLRDTSGRYQAKRERVISAAELAPGASLPSAHGTWWGALNAVTYHVDHQANQANPAGRTRSAWLGGGATSKQQALSLALAVAQ